jgi:hypothetical protein
MNKLFIALTLLTFTSCTDSNVETKATTIQVGSYSTPLRIIVIDKCEYLWGDWSHATVLTHKGNCSNSIHKIKSKQ